MRLTAVSLAAAALLAACATAPTTPAPDGAIRVAAKTVALDASDPLRDRLGAFRYAGGLSLSSPDTDRLHGLSDLKVWPDGRLLAVSDEGDLFEGRLLLDAAGRLKGVTAGKLAPLRGPDGQTLASRGKAESDSEGIAQLSNGDRLVSLERDHRILLYPALGGPPRLAPKPDVSFPLNDGMEALAADPEAGADAYVVGAESTGQTWTCRLSAACVDGPVVGLPEKDAGLTAVTVLPGGRRAYLLRAFSVAGGVRVTLRVVDAKGATLDEVRLASPLTVDNFEGLAGISRPDGSVRFYLLADDNFSPAERTLLLAFDWTPNSGR